MRRRQCLSFDISWSQRSPLRPRTKSSFPFSLFFFSTLPTHEEFLPFLFFFDFCFLFFFLCFLMETLGLDEVVSPGREYGFYPRRNAFGQMRGADLFLIFRSTPRPSQTRPRFSRFSDSLTLVLCEFNTNLSVS